MDKKQKNILWFEEIDKDDGVFVGGKGANLGEMVGFGIPVPPGFVVASKAYYDFLEENQLRIVVRQSLQTVDVNNPKQLIDVAERIQRRILKGKVPGQVAKDIISAYEKLGGKFSKHVFVAVRSSATAEDLPDASFAGQQETFLNIKGEANVVNKVRECWASLFTPRAIFYREQKEFDHFKVGIAVPVQKMIQSEKSGIMFTIDPLSNDKTKIIIEAIYGLGEMIVQGFVTPDHYEVTKKDLKIVNKQINRQKIQLTKSDNLTKQTKVKPGLQEKQKISKIEILNLAKLGKKIHQHYFFPQDIEWAIEKEKIYILQTRPVTTIKQEVKSKKQEEFKKINLPILVEGSPASPGIVSGHAVKISSVKQISKVKIGEILVTDMTTPDFVPVMKKAAAIVTNKGGQTSHAAIVSRELGIPCVVGTGNATELVKDGLVLTVDGKSGKVYKGGLKKEATLNPFIEEKKQQFSPIYNLQPQKIVTATKVYVNLGEPDLASNIAKKDVDGVGLLRAEFMISEYIREHPKKLIKEKKERFFIDRLIDGLTKFCQAFDPRPVVYRATDFKTNEYRNLIGGKAFEPVEENPMLGYRGAFRYIADESVFELELKAIKKVRNKLGYRNLWLMIPFVRTVRELQLVKKIIVSNGLARSPSFKLWMMVEIPSNIILLEDFIKIGIDGISIGTNDLTMLLLGTDRDNQEISSEFDERNPAVLWALKRAVKIANKNKVTSSICGQAPSVYPDLTNELVGWGITSISVNPDMIDQTRQIIFEAEKRTLRQASARGGQASKK